jgi:co-chaperonin GroES (HSP10)
MLDSRLRWGAIAALSLVPLQVSPTALHAQAPAAARQLGTVKAIDGSTLTLTTSAGATVTVTVAPDAKVLQLPPGSTSLKDATQASVADVAVGDRVLATGAAGDANSLTASRVILMKSSDIAARNAEEMREWQRGLGGLVKSVDGSTITVASGTRMLKIETTPATVFKRYAADSVSFTDAQPGSLSGIHAGDQLRARGTVADDRLSMTAKEVVSGSFENLSGVISAVNASAGTLTLKDLATKKTVTVAVTSKSDLRNLPAQAAAAFAARNAPGAGAGAGQPGAAQAARPAGASGAGAGSAGGYGSRRAGADLSQMLSRLPTQTLADLHTGEAVMIVASPGANGSPTAITLLSGVETILSATPAGQQPITLSPWNIGAPEGAAAGGEGGGSN